MKKGKGISFLKKVNTTPKNKLLVDILTSKLLLCLVIIAMVIALANTKGICSYYTDKKIIEDTFTVESHTITYNYYVVGCSGNSVQMERTETRKGYTGTSIVLGADETLMISNDNNTYYKMDFKISGAKYEKDDESG